MKVCPQHGEISLDRADFCPLCGRKLLEADAITAALDLLTDPPPRRQAAMPAPSEPSLFA